MTVINAVQIFMLLWGFIAVCQTDADGCNVSCNNVTGAVRKEVIFNCSFSEQCTEDCAKLYKFQYPQKYNDSAIYREGSADDPCKKKKTFTCRYTPDTAIKETFRFFVQTNSSRKTAGFTVDISEHESLINVAGPDPSSVPEDPRHENTPVSAISAGVGCIIIIIIIIIILTIIIIYKKKTDLHGSQERWL
ncbi:uncharacterized protein LOC130238866 isoform X2 [Danio aesculapii]|uniref:uncharacterized protein LOC130238866 isoform X2 n=1 Tax=Danio aesculapii TaxID=1142201 RepID=UPI0024C097DF|nr:uncharacterized protein LOC130238866 isoform X2 [Danio aesculapii]